MTHFWKGGGKKTPTLGSSQEANSRQCYKINKEVRLISYVNLVKQVVSVV